MVKEKTTNRIMGRAVDVTENVHKLFKAMIFVIMDFDSFDS